MVVTVFGTVHRVTVLVVHVAQVFVVVVSVALMFVHRGHLRDMLVAVCTVSGVFVIV